MKVIGCFYSTIWLYLSFLTVCIDLFCFMTEEAKLAAVPDIKIDVNRFKYIQIEVRTSCGKSKIVVRGDASKEYHADIYDSEAPGIRALGLDAEPKGGGRILHDPTAKTLSIFGYSMGYGKADHNVTAEILKKQYPDYKITVSDEGY